MHLPDGITIDAEAARKSAFTLVLDPHGAIMPDRQQALADIARHLTILEAENAARPAAIPLPTRNDAIKGHCVGSGVDA